MKLQLVCVVFILLSGATRNISAFKLQTDAEKDLTSLERHEAEPAANAVQVSLRRAKRFNTHFPACRYCCNCCGNKGCGMCCWA